MNVHRTLASYCPSPRRVPRPISIEAEERYGQKRWYRLSVNTTYVRVRSTTRCFSIILNCNVLKRDYRGMKTHRLALMNG